MAQELKPTVWRTARALANADRLNLLRLIARSKGGKGVTELAEEAGLPVPTASLYLRALNARGLISVVRSGPFVYYGTSSDRSLPAAAALQEAFRRLFASRRIPKDWTDRLFPVLQAYSSPRRVEIVRILAERSPLSYAELHALAGMPETSFLRHLGRLTAAGVVLRGDNAEYSLAKPRNSLEAALLSALR